MGTSLNFLSLFSGIGGLDLGLERAGMACVGQVELDPFCRAVLAKHWKHVPRHDDVSSRVYRESEADYIAAGFPCQGISNAGLRAGLSDPRSRLFWESVRAICVVRPIGAVLENVAALLTRGMGVVLGALAEIGYDTEWDCISASALGAIHHRDRIFIRAIRSDASSMRPQRIWATPQGPWTREQLAGLVQAELRISVPAGKSGGVADGVSGRTHRLKGLGNAVVPQVAEVIGRAIMAAASEAA